MWITVLGFAIAGVVGWLAFAKLHGDSFVRNVASLVANDLRKAGEPESAIRAYLNSMQFAVLAKTSYGRVPAYEAFKIAITKYLDDEEKWRSIGDKENQIADLAG